MDPGRALDDVTGEIVDAAFKLHTPLGPGFLESVYETVLCRDLQRRGPNERQQDSRHLCAAWSRSVVGTRKMG